MVEHAAAVVDELGFESLTLARVAERSGVRLPSLYKHVEGVDAVRRDLAVRALGELAAALSVAVVRRTGPPAVFALAGAYREYAHAHPGLYATTLRAPAAQDAEHLAAADAVLRVVYAVLAGNGVADEDMVDLTRALRAAMHGFVTLEAGGGFAMADDVDRSYRVLITALVDSL